MVGFPLPSAGHFHERSILSAGTAGSCAPGFGEKDLPGVEAGVLQRRPLRLNLTAVAVAGHLPTEKTSPRRRVGNGMVEASSRARRRKSVMRFWVMGRRSARRWWATLHGVLRRRRWPVNPVLTDPSAGHDDEIPRAWPPSVGELSPDPPGMIPPFRSTPGVFLRTGHRRPMDPLTGIPLLLPLCSTPPALLRRSAWMEEAGGRGLNNPGSKQKVST